MNTHSTYTTCTLTIDPAAQGVANQMLAGQRGAVVALEVDNMADYEAKLKASGAVVIQRRDMGSHGSVVAFRDTEGNIVQLFAKAAP